MCEDTHAEYEVCMPCQLCDLSSEDELWYDYLTTEMHKQNPTMAFPVDVAQVGGAAQHQPIEVGQLRVHPVVDATL